MELPPSYQPQEELADASEIFSVPLCLCGEKVLEPRLNPLRQGPEIRHALQLIIRQLNPEMLFQPRQQIERLQAVNTKCLEEVAIRSKFLPRYLKMRGGQVQDFIESLISCRHIRNYQLQITNYQCYGR